MEVEWMGLIPWSVYLLLLSVHTTWTSFSPSSHWVPLVAAPPGCVSHTMPPDTDCAATFSFTHTRQRMLSPHQGINMCARLTRVHKRFSFLPSSCRRWWFTETTPFQQSHAYIIPWVPTTTTDLLSKSAHHPTLGSGSRRQEGACLPFLPPLEAHEPAVQAMRRSFTRTALITNFTEKRQISIVLLKFLERKPNGSVFLNFWPLPRFCMIKSSLTHSW